LSGALEDVLEAEPPQTVRRPVDDLRVAVRDPDDAAE
jgi:hypothetical protein